MRSGSAVVCGKVRPSVGATSVQSPPSAGIDTMFALAPGAVCRAASRKLRAGPWMATSRSPSGDHAGCWKIAGRVLSRTGGVLPSARTLYRWPPSSADQVTNAIHAPSGDQAGCASTRSRSVSRRGSPSGIGRT